VVQEASRQEAKRTKVNSKVYWARLYGPTSEGAWRLPIDAIEGRMRKRRKVKELTSSGALESPGLHI